jgi:catechol 2,3-dioxygenase-like lactoylglutathione lyase family enzyme
LTKSLAAVAFLVPDYDDAIAWIRGARGFDFIEGAPLPLAKAADARQRAAAGGRVADLLETDDFSRDHGAASAPGGRFHGSLRREPRGVVAVFADPRGGRWDPLQSAKRQGRPAS